MHGRFNGAEYAVHVDGEATRAAIYEATRQVVDAVGQVRYSYYFLWISFF
jgi:hypothetical protein